MMSELNMSYGKLSDFVSFLLLEFTLIIKLRNFDFENHCNTLRFFGKKHMTSDVNIPHGEMSVLFHFHCLGLL